MITPRCIERGSACATSPSLRRLIPHNVIDARPHGRAAQSQGRRGVRLEAGTSALWTTVDA